MTKYIQRGRVNCKLIDYNKFSEEFEARRIAGEIQYRDQHHKPGDCYSCPWYVSDVKGEWYDKEQIANFLSVHYVNDWFGIRYPIMVVCPNNKLWCVDQKSSNGTGWTVTLPDNKLPAFGEPLKITARPSIIAGDYHGWITDGVFKDA